jgi:hypothetical protein
MTITASMDSVRERSNSVTSAASVSAQSDSASLSRRAMSPNRKILQISLEQKRLQKEKDKDPDQAPVSPRMSDGTPGPESPRESPREAPSAPRDDVQNGMYAFCVAFSDIHSPRYFQALSHDCPDP